MWLALSSIVLGTAIGSNVLALWLTGIRGEHYHAGYQQSIVTVSGHSLRS